MKQFAVVYKPNRMPLAFYCTESAAMDRMMFITDCNVFGVFEVDVDIISVLKSEDDCWDSCTLGVVCTINKCLLSVHLESSTAFQHKEAIKSGLFKVCHVSYKLGKEIKRPKKDDEEEEC